MSYCAFMLVCFRLLEATPLLMVMLGNGAHGWDYDIV